MSSVSVEIGLGHTHGVKQVAIQCPFCHAKVTPKYLFLHEGVLFAFCPNSDCNKHFVLNSNGFGDFTIIQPNYVPTQKLFSDTIKRVSDDFTIIYNQAYYAEQVSLNQICGVGYRKALEFLIKDYLLSGISEEEVEKKECIKNKLLGKCISEDVTNEQIKIVAKRAAWLGNDETHYVRKWTEKDVSHLKQLIELTVRWIENEIETRALLADMPEGSNIGNRNDPTER